MAVLLDKVLQGGTGLAHVVEIGQRLRVTDLEGLQVIDMAVFNADNPREKRHVAKWALKLESGNQ